MKTFYYTIFDKKLNRKNGSYTYYFRIYEIEQNKPPLLIGNGNYNTGITRGEESEIFKNLARNGKVEKEFINSYASDVETYKNYKLYKLA